MWWLVTPRNNTHRQCLGPKMPCSRNLCLERSDITQAPYLEQGNPGHSTQFLGLDSETVRIQGSPGAKILGLCSFNRGHLTVFHLVFPFRRHPSLFQGICNGRVGSAVTEDFVSISVQPFWVSGIQSSFVTVAGPCSMLPLTPQWRTSAFSLSHLWEGHGHTASLGRHIALLPSKSQELFCLEL